MHCLYFGYGLTVRVNGKKANQYWEIIQNNKISSIKKHNKGFNADKAFRLAG